MPEAWWGWENADSPGRTETVIRALRKLDLRSFTLIDIACGSGDLADDIAMEFPRADVRAIDITAQDHWFYLTYVRPEVLSVQDLITADTKFDVAVMLNSYRNWTGKAEEKTRFDDWIGRNVKHFITSDSGKNNLPWPMKVIGKDFKGHDMVLYTL